VKIRDKIRPAAIIVGLVGGLVLELALRSINGFLSKVGGSYDDERIN
jgi:hypothetical protein